MPVTINFKARLAFPKLNKPEEFKAGQGNARYSAAFLIDPKSDSAKKVVAAIKEAAKETWPKNGDKKYEQLKSQDKLALHDGNNKADLDGYEGMLYLNASAKPEMPPTLLYSKNGKNHNVENREEQTLIYAGCYVVARVTFWGQTANSGFGERINASLLAVQFAGDGDRFGASAVNPEDMEVLDVEPSNQVTSPFDEATEEFEDEPEDAELVEDDNADLF